MSKEPTTAASKTAAAPAVMSCKCSGPNANGPASQYQDSRYGKGKRLHNPTLKTVGTAMQYRCTCCGSMKTR